MTAFTMTALDPDISDTPSWRGYVRATPEFFQEQKARHNAAVYDADEYWLFTNCKSALLDAEIGDAVILPTESPREYLYEWLNERWPAQRRDYSSVYLFEQRDYSRAPVGAMPTAFVVRPYVWYTPCDDKPDMARVAALAKELSPQPLLFQPRGDCRQLPWPKYERNPRSKRYVYYSEIEQLDCYVRVVKRELAGETRDVHEIVYDPKVTARRLASRTTMVVQQAKQASSQKSMLAVEDLTTVIHGLYLDLPDWTRKGRALPYPKTRSQGIYYLCHALSFYDGCCQQVGAYRQHGLFQALVRLWRNKSIGPNTRAGWSKRMATTCEVKQFEQFCRFMDVEAKRRLPKTAKPQVPTLKEPW